MPKVSIIIPALNSIKHLRECMDSMVAQTLTDIEIIPVDAGSDDGTWELFREYAANDPRVKPIMSAYKSHGHQCNLGMDAATGDYIGFVETDDYTAHDMFETLYNAAEESGVDWVRSNHAQFMEVDGERLFLESKIFPEHLSELYNCVINPRERRAIMTASSMNYIWNGIYRRDFLRENNVRLNETPGAAFQDTGFFNQVLMRAEQVQIIPEFLYYYRRDCADSSNNSGRCLQFLVDEFGYLLQYLERHVELADIWLPFLHSRFLTMFTSWIGKYIRSDQCPANMRDSIEHFVDLLKKSLGMMVDRQLKYHADIGQNHPLMGDIDKCYQKLFLEKQIREYGYRRCFDQLGAFSKIVIFGAGEPGACYYAFLRNRGINRVVCFCDNDSKKHGTKLLGLPVCSLEEATAQHPDAGYAVTNARFTHENISRLLKKNIGKAQICGIGALPRNFGDIMSDSIEECHNMYAPKISVVIPVYNAERFLRQCLDSVLRQPMRELEIICVNDGSTDNSPWILDEYAQNDRRVHVIHQPNLHSGIARNNGLEAARGEYIHFLDADDYLTDNAYEETYRIAREYKLDYLKAKAYVFDYFSGALVGGSIADRYALNMMHPEDYEIPFSFAGAPEKLTTTPVYAPWSGIYRRDFLMGHNIRFDSLQSFDDHSFYYAVAVHAKRVMVADVYMLFYRRNNPNSLMGNYLKRFAGHFESFRIISEDCRFLSKKPYALVLNAEIGSLFLWYHMALAQKVDAERAHRMMCDFVRTFDISLTRGVCEDASWYPDYLMLKWEVGSMDGTLSESEIEDLISELKEKVWKTIPLPLEKLRRNSKIVLYGAGGVGRRTHRQLRTLRFCEIILWVDKNWEKLQSKNIPVSNPDDISSAQYDSVLVAVEKPEVASEIQAWLIEKGISRDKIISNAGL